MWNQTFGWFTQLKMFLPTTKSELTSLGWDKLDIILITGDSYIDSPYMGTTLIGKALVDRGYRVGIIAQPDFQSDKDITRLGEPELFWGVSGGAVDSMVANYTALKKKRKSDDFTPGGINNKRPDRAVIVYSNLIRKYFKQTKPIVLGGIEASLRRVAHYDYWSDKIRKPIIFDAKADALVYGMGEKTIIQLADAIKADKDYRTIRGLCYVGNDLPDDYLQLPSFEEVTKQKHKFVAMFHTFYQNNDPLTAKGLAQLVDTRYLIQNPPEAYMSQAELDKVYNLKYEHAQHPYYEKSGKVKALDTIKFSITTHRGCYGECNFCAISVHQGKTIRWRSEASILKEAKAFAKDPDFKGNIFDAGGPTANMYGFECAKKLKSGSCTDKRCMYPEICATLKPDHSRQLNLLKKMRKIEGIKKVFIASGLRYDLILEDTKAGEKYMDNLLLHHTSGQLKIAPEHTAGKVLDYMGKPKDWMLTAFSKMFQNSLKRTHTNKFLTYYLIAAHPGCTDQDMTELKQYASSNLKINPEQVQVFTPLPSTYSALMYYTESDPFTGKKLFVEKNLQKKAAQKETLTRKKRYKQ